MQIFVQHGVQQLGPFTEEELKEQLASGAIMPQDYVWREGQANWILLSESPYAPEAVVSPKTGTAVIPELASPKRKGPTFPAMAPMPDASAPAGEPPKSSLPVWALVCGCFGLICSIFTSIPAIVLGHMSLSRIKKNPGMQGQGMAMAGLIMGYIFTAASVVLIPIIAISVLIALGNQVKDVFSTINSQLAMQTNSPDQTEQSSNSPDTSGSTTNSDQSTNAAPSPGGSDQSTNAAPAAPSSTDTSTNAPAMNQ